LPDSKISALVDGNPTVAATDEFAVARAGANRKVKLGTMAAQAANAVAITGGTIAGITDLAIADGGTGAGTKLAAFDALSPAVVQGDIIFRDAANNVKLAIGTAAQVLKTNAGATAPEWANETKTNIATDTIWDAAGDIVYAHAADNAERLPVGTAGQVLTVKAGATDLEWATPGVVGVATDPIWDVAGDLVIGTGANTAVKLPIGTANQILAVNAGATAPEWKAPPVGIANDNIWDAVADLVYGTGPDTATRLAKGTALQVLRMNAAANAPEWAAASAGSGDVATDVIWDAAGDLVVGTGVDTATRLPKGTANQVLAMKADASTAEWTTLSGVDILATQVFS
jgi:hypothetical protein